MDLLAVALVAASSKTTSPSAGSSAASLIFIVIIGLAAYFLFIRPRSAAARRQRETLQEIVPGDEVLTGAGIFGTVLDVMEDRVTIETAPGTRITVLRSTIARRITPETEAPEESWTDEDEHAAHHELEGGADHSGTAFEGSADAEGHNGSRTDAEPGTDAPDDDAGARHDGEDQP
ncbi:MAG TPA: preprotein translocase subunit YajC [Acidimicrobiaceae bacterium]|nr:preprotein translocase subunit YajC [Acidimicrobiaceae bacterium]